MKSKCKVIGKVNLEELKWSMESERKTRVRRGKSTRPTQKGERTLQGQLLKIKNGSV